MIRSSGIPKYAPLIASIRPPARTFLPIFLMKTKLVLAGKAKAEIAAAIASALEKKELPPLAPGNNGLHDVEAAVSER